MTRALLTIMAVGSVWDCGCAPDKIDTMPRPQEQTTMLFTTINPLIALGVVLTTGFTDAAYVMFTSAVVAKKRVPAAREKI
jgi:hypothetical protein